jgi:hypothetical protein
VINTQNILVVDRNMQVQQDIHCCNWWPRPRQLRANKHTYTEAARVDATVLQLRAHTYTYAEAVEPIVRGEKAQKRED